MVPSSSAAGAPVSALAPGSAALAPGTSSAAGAPDSAALAPVPKTPPQAPSWWQSSPSDPINGVYILGVAAFLLGRLVRQLGPVGRPETHRSAAVQRQFDGNAVLSSTCHSCHVVGCFAPVVQAVVCRSCANELSYSRLLRASLSNQLLFVYLVRMS